jgi:hypothetical protein
MISNHLTLSKVLLLFLFSREAWKPAVTARQGLPQFSRPQRSTGLGSAKSKDNNKGLCLDPAENLFISVGFRYLHRSKKNDDINYHYYSTAPIGGPWATDRGTCNARKSKARRTPVQMKST